MKYLALFFAGFFSLVLNPNCGFAEKMTPELLKENLDKIPPKDPPCANAPKVMDAMKGVHPRLLFTAKEIEALKVQIEKDPLLKTVYENSYSWCKRFKFNSAIMDSLTTGDQGALTTGDGTYPQFAFIYALSHDPNSKQAIIDILKAMLEEPYWANSTHELDASMGAGCNMMMFAVLYDAVYNDLPLDLRAQCAQRILIQARRMFYLGHKGLSSYFPGKGFWQGDPQNNHRWYRMRGLASCMLAIADEKGLDTDYLMNETKKEMDFLIKWNPQDGDCHEGRGYQAFGFRSLLETALMMDRVLGTQYIKNPGFCNAWKQQIYYWIPAGHKVISFGDDMNGADSFQANQPPFFFGPHLTRDKNAEAALLRWYKLSAYGARGNPLPPSWTFLEFYDPTVGEGDYKALPTYCLFADLGAASIRDSWDEEAVVLTFKCGPYGGYKLCEFRDANRDKNGDLQGVNHAHDDPDANSIAMSLGADYVFHPGVYAVKKATNTISTITVDGKGQIMEGDDYTQPFPKFDERKLSYLTGWKVDDKGRIIIEGEAGSAYRGMTGPEINKIYYAAISPTNTNIENKIVYIIPDPVLKKFRRSTIWMPGEYVLVLDDIATDGQQRSIVWRGTVEKTDFINPAEGRCQIITKSGRKVGMQILGNKPFQGGNGYSFLCGRFANELQEQFQFSVKSDSIKWACLLDPWNKKASLTFKENGDAVTLHVQSAGFDDVWTWKSATDDQTPSSIECKRGGSKLITLSEKDKAPHGD